ncbi:MAG: RNA polymerase sigma factor [Bacteroidetes bacterium]|nr:RNA polymerase sigma factor [Bacteroidota bacterium]
MEQYTFNHPVMVRQHQERIEDSVKKEKSRLQNFIRARVSSPEDAEDILQDVFYQLTAGIQALESLDQITNWLFTVARNKIIDWYRKKKPVAFSYLEHENPETDENYSLYDLLPDLSQSPDERYTRSLIWDALEEALEELPIEQKEVFVFHEFEDKSFKEIARLTEVPVNTLISRKRYAVIYLREKLIDFYKDL